MSVIRADDHEISLLLDRLVTGHGGMLHADIEMVCEQDELSIHTCLDDSNQDEIIFVAEVSRPCPDEFSVRLKPCCRSRIIIIMSNWDSY